MLLNTELDNNYEEANWSRIIFDKLAPGAAATHGLDVRGERIYVQSDCAAAMIVTIYSEKGQMVATRPLLNTSCSWKGIRSGHYRVCVSNQNEDSEIGCVIGAG